MERNISFSSPRHLMSSLLVLLFLAVQCCLADVPARHLLRGARGSLQAAPAGGPGPLLPRQDEQPVIDSVESTKKYIKAPANNKGAFWSGIPFELSQSAAAAAGLQTLEQSVGTEITGHPDAQRGTPTNPQFWDWFSEGFSQTIVESGSTEVTVLLRAPNRLLTGPSDPYTDGRMVQRSNWSEIEFPIMRENNIRVLAMHPGENGRPAIDPYEIWPNDEGYLWQERWQGGQERTEELMCGPGENSVLVQCETPQDPDTFTIGCPDVPGTLEPPVAGGQCNFTIEPPVNPQVNTFTVTSVLTTAAVKLLLECFSSTCSGTGLKEKRVLTDEALARRKATRELHAASEVLVF